MFESHTKTHYKLTCNTCGSQQEFVDDLPENWIIIRVNDKQGLLILERYQEEKSFETMTYSLGKPQAFCSRECLHKKAHELVDLFAAGISPAVKPKNHKPV